MEDNLSNLMIGIIGGVVSSAIIWFFVLIYNKIIQPAIKEILYKGIDLEGEWHDNLYIERSAKKDGKTELEKVKIKELTITIKQNAYEIKGDLIIKNIIHQNEIFSFYKYTGFIRDNYVVINYLPKSKKHLGLGSIILVIKKGGKCLNGNLVGTSLDEMNLTQYSGLHLERK
ncbi:hypothetical protein [Prolixibacter denitrificans]|uniref:SMODS-associating 2TM beta-strand rich effector domain-containing protein n=1 Tax=Prolixibacter denitrificans TaxID=1541063 RepID=A0A2P8C6K7_9BACT|nr:hypothetical protein [Prolixibacter denitrificans]PSK80610.1 hypothetical protein CLV93_11447 [Prolixibacter denitrificans]GET22096.1 hypothetical protein JCM18694_23420 [Prolixibacter denitrificans]